VEIRGLLPWTHIKSDMLNSISDMLLMTFKDLKIKNDEQHISFDM